jgi:hypothetical protein
MPPRLLGTAAFFNRNQTGQCCPLGLSPSSAGDVELRDFL